MRLRTVSGGGWKARDDEKSYEHSVVLMDKEKRRRWGARDGLVSLPMSSLCHGWQREGHWVTGNFRFGSLSEDGGLTALAYWYCLY